MQNLYKGLVEERSTHILEQVVEWCGELWDVAVTSNEINQVLKKLVERVCVIVKMELTI